MKFKIFSWIDFSLKKLTAPPNKKKHTKNRKKSIDQKTNTTKFLKSEKNREKIVQKNLLKKLLKKRRKKKEKWKNMWKKKKEKKKKEKKRKREKAKEKKASKIFQKKRLLKFFFVFKFEKIYIFLDLLIDFWSDLFCFCLTQRHPKHPFQRIFHVSKKI